MDNKTIQWTGENQIEISDFLGHENFWHNKKKELLIKINEDMFVVKKGQTFGKNKNGYFIV